MWVFLLTLSYSTFINHLRYTGKVPNNGNNSVQRDNNSMDRDRPDAKKGYKGNRPRLGIYVHSCWLYAVVGSLYIFIYALICRRLFSTLPSFTIVHPY